MVIGLDAGGTKLLGASLGEGLTLGPRVRHTWAGEDRDATLEVIARAVQDIRAQAGEVAAVGPRGAVAGGLGRRRLALVEPPAPGRPPAARAHDRAAGPAGGRRQRRQRRGAGRAPRGRGPGQPRTPSSWPWAPGSAAAWCWTGRSTAAATATRASSATSWSTTTAPTAPAPAPAAAAWRRWPRAAPSAWPASAPRATRRTRRSGAGWPSRAPCWARWSPSSRTRATRPPGPCWPTSAAGWAPGLTGIVNALDPDVVVIGGGAVTAGDLLLDPAREVVAARALPPVARAVRIVPARFGEEAGLLGAGLLALGEQPAGRMRSEVLSEPGRLPDADRQPGGHHAARAVGAARGRRGGVRGHPAHAHAARPLRRQRAAGQLPRAQRAAAGLRAGRADAGGGDGGAGLRRGHAAGVRPRLRAGPGLRGRRASASRCCPGPRPRWRRWWPRRCPPTAGASPASCRASAASCRRCSARRAGR